MTQEELNVILEKHREWMNGNRNGERANLYEANLYEADLYEANLRGADLRGANLHGANLRGADLRGANLHEADLYGADLYGANLRGADLRGANLHEANLRGADLRGADLYGANLRGAKNIPFIPSIPPEEGAFIGFKKAQNYIIKLLIPEEAKRSSATTRKCRCDKAKVISITNLDGSDTNITSVSSDYDKSFVYIVGQTVSVCNFEDNRWKECAAGIHFFINRQEAVDY